MPRSILTPVLIVATLAAAPAKPTALSISGQSATEERETTRSDLYSLDFDHGPVSGWATVRRTQLGVAVVVSAAGLTPGNVYVLTGAAAQGADVALEAYLSGNVASRHGTTTFVAHLEQPGSIDDPGYWIPRLMLRDAGAATRGELSRQLLGLTGPCVPTSPECFRLVQLGGSQ